MTRDLRTAALASVTVHAALFFPGWIVQPASVDVERGPVSVAVELVSEAQAALPEAGLKPAAPRPEPGESWVRERDEPRGLPRPNVDTSETHGAFIAARPNGASNRPPAYPWLARIRGWEGTVVLLVRIEADGHPRDVGLLHSSGYPILDIAAQQAIQQWAFTPARRAGRAVGSDVELPVRFRLTPDREAR